MSDIQVTYYLGAGASANAVPMVSQIRDYYEPFLSFIRKKIAEIKWREDMEINKLDLISEFESITKNLKKHCSPDTFAKKIWLQEDNEKLEYLKYYLSMFFYWIENEYSSLDMDFSVMHCRSVTGGSDERYDPFLATLLERASDSHLRFPSNINIITWNYDTQFEIAYSNFVKTVDYDLIRSGLNIIPNSSDQIYLPNHSKIVKLNGCSKLYSAKKLSRIINLSNAINSNEILSKYLLQVAFMQGAKRDWGSPLINFAWETDNSASQETLKEAKKVFSKTQILVIVGYSFPTFNRKVDKDLFSDLSPDCTVYYQARKSDVHDLIDKLKSIKHLTNPVKPVINLDQFHIPIEL